MARVVFASPSSPARTPWSVVYLHGFSATRQETAPVSEQVAAALGANLFEARLTGHGLPGDSMGVATARAWITDAEWALATGARLGDSVVVIATSTGGTLATWLGAQPEAARRALKAVVLISPNFGVNGAASAVLSWPWAPVVLPRLIPSYSWTPLNEAHGRYWTTSYPSQALFPMTALVNAVNDLPLREWTTPTLVLANPADPVVDGSAVTAWTARLRASSKVRVELEQITPATGEDGHVLAGRIMAPSRVGQFVGRILRFLRS
jgi:alpha-beta hydrolase superfamily lysophospholipase